MKSSLISERTTAAALSLPAITPANSWKTTSAPFTQRDRTIASQWIREAINASKPGSVKACRLWYNHPTTKREQILIEALPRLLQCPNLNLDESDDNTRRSIQYPVEDLHERRMNQAPIRGPEHHLLFAWYIFHLHKSRPRIRHCLPRTLTVGIPSLISVTKPTNNVTKTQKNPQNISPPTSHKKTRNSL